MLTADAAHSPRPAAAGAALSVPVAVLAHLALCNDQQGAVQLPSALTAFARLPWMPTRLDGSVTAQPEATVCAAFAHALWAAPLHAWPAVQSHMRALVRALGNCDSAAVTELSSAAAAVQEACTTALSASLRTQSGTQLLQQGCASSAGVPGHALHALLMHAHWQRSTLAAAAQHSDAPSSLSMLRYAAAKAAGILALPASPHSAVLCETFNALLATARLAIAVLQPALQSWLAAGAPECGARGSTGADVNPSGIYLLKQDQQLVQELLCITGYTLQLLQAPAQSAAGNKAVRGSAVAPPITPLLHAVYALEQLWQQHQHSAMADTALALQRSSKEAAQLTVTLRAASAACGLQAEKQAGMLRQRLWPPVQVQAVDGNAGFWRWLLQASLHHASISGSATQALAQALAQRGMDASASEPVNGAALATLLANADLRSHMVHAAALCIASATQGADARGACTEVLVQLRSSVQRAVAAGAASPGALSKPAAGSIMPDAEKVLRTGSGALAAGATCSLATIVTHSRPVSSAACAAAVAASACVATGVASSSDEDGLVAAPPATMLQAAATAAGGAAGRSVAEAAHWQVLAWLADAREALPDTLLFAALQHWHAHASATLRGTDASSVGVPQGPQAFTAALRTLSPSCSVRQSATAPRDAAGAAALSGICAAVMPHCAAFTYCIAVRALQGAATLSDAPVHSDMLAQAVHAVLAHHAATQQHTALQVDAAVWQELQVLCASSSYTLAALAASASTRLSDADNVLLRTAARCLSSLAKTEVAALGRAPHLPRHATDALCTAQQALRRSAAAALCSFADALARLVAALAPVAGTEETGEARAWVNASPLAQTGVAWAQMGAARAQLLLPSAALDPAAAAEERLRVLQHRHDALAAPALAVARLAAPNALLRPHDALLDALCDDCKAAQQAVEAAKACTCARTEPARYAAVAADVHAFVHSTLLPAADSEQLLQLQTAASPMSTFTFDSGAARGAALERAAVLAQWCEEAAQDADFADILTPVVVAAREVQRGLLLLVAAVDRQRAAARLAACELHPEHSLRALLGCPIAKQLQLLASGTPPPFAPAAQPFDRQLQLLAQQPHAGAESGPGAQPALQLRLQLHHVAGCAAAAQQCALPRGAASALHLLQSLAALARQCQEAQAANNAEEAAKASAWKQKETRCHSLPHSFDGLVVRCSAAPLAMQVGHGGARA